MFYQATKAAKGKKVIITETGWPSKGGTEVAADSNEENAIRYFINTQKWFQKDNVDIFYFSSFDESWKAGDVGVYCGFWDKNEKRKF